MRFRILYVLFFVLFFVLDCRAQDSVFPKDTINSSSTSDSTVLALSTEAPHLRNPKSGTLAILLSAVVPGAGQVYAERYYTIPLIWGVGIFFYSQYNQANSYYKDFRSRYELSVKQDTIAHTGNSYFKEVRDFYHDKRDEFLIYIGLTYVLNILDAYVGATLYNFDVSPQLNGGLTIQYRIPIR